MKRVSLRNEYMCRCSVWLDATNDAAYKIKAHLITDSMFSTNHRELRTLHITAKPFYKCFHYFHTSVSRAGIDLCQHCFFCNRIMQCIFRTICTYTLYHTVKFQVPAYSFLWHTEIGANQWMLGTKKHIWKSETWWHSLKKDQQKCNMYMIYSLKVKTCKHTRIVL